MFDLLDWNVHGEQGNAIQYEIKKIFSCVGKAEKIVLRKAQEGKQLLYRDVINFRILLEGEMSGANWDILIMRKKYNKKYKYLLDTVSLTINL